MRGPQARGEPRAVSSDVVDVDVRLKDCGGELPARGALPRKPPETVVAPVTDYGERPAYSSRGTERVHEGQLRSLNQKHRSSK
jgi:hypothetical protein